MFMNYHYPMLGLKNSVIIYSVVQTRKTLFSGNTKGFFIEEWTGYFTIVINSKNSLTA